ncbi:MAG: hypothetical protein KGK17_06815 [Betaproteobacteria bacterium]|nr:hypothetical protein [Betaproteobacteria bacterium]
MMEGFKKYLAAVIAFLLVGCGGGGGGGGANSTPGVFQAQGIAQGTTGVGNAQLAVILETGELYNFSTAGNIVLTVDHGTLAELGDAYSGNITEFNVAATTTSSGTIYGLFIAQSAITGTLTINAVEYYVYTSTYIPTYNYFMFSSTYLSTYNTPASLGTLAGTYTGVYDYGGSPVTLSVSATGAINGTSNNCAISGTATPRPSGKSVFNVSLTLTGANCVPGGVGTATGIAVLNNGSDGRTHLYMGSLNAAGTNGFFWVGTKQ